MSSIYDYLKCKEVSIGFAISTGSLVTCNCSEREESSSCECTNGTCEKTCSRSSDSDLLFRGAESRRPKVSWQIGALGRAIELVNTKASTAGHDDHLVSSSLGWLKVEIISISGNQQSLSDALNF